MRRRLFLQLCLTSYAAGKDWNSFRGPAASGVAEGIALPVDWQLDKGVGVVWKSAIGGLGHSSPVVANGKIFITTAVASREPGALRPGSSGGISSANDLIPHKWQVLALDEKTGKLLWESTAFEGVPKIKRHVKASHANSTAATNGAVVAAMLGSEGLYVYEAASGRLLWKKDLGVLNVGLKNEMDTQWGFATSPVIAGSRLIVQCDTNGRDFVVAFDLRSGKELWRSTRDEFPAWSTPLILETAAGTQIVTNSPRYTRGLDPETGKELWRFADETEVKVSSPVAAHGSLIISGGYPQGRPFFALRIDALRGGGELGKEAVAWRVEKGGPYTTTPLAYGDHLYVMSDQGILGCYEVRTGREVYRQRVPSTGGNYSASPVGGDGKIYLASEDGDLHIVRAGAKFELLKSHPFGSALMATPAIVNGRLLVRSQGWLWSIGKA
jgi:outer membrane protein assembly factor BamB